MLGFTAISTFNSIVHYFCSDATSNCSAVKSSQESNLTGTSESKGIKIELGWITSYACTIQPSGCKFLRNLQATNNCRASSYHHISKGAKSARCLCCTQSAKLHDLAAGKALFRCRRESILRAAFVTGSVRSTLDAMRNIVSTI